MKKRLIALPDPTEEWLVTEAKRLDLSVSELIRRLLDDARKRSERRS